jgi:hypothetical protein
MKRLRWTPWIGLAWVLVDAGRWWISAQELDLGWFAGGIASYAIDAVLTLGPWLLFILTP